MYSMQATGKPYRPDMPEQDLLLPPSLRDWLPESDLIHQLDLSAITTEYEDEDRGADRTI